MSAVSAPLKMTSDAVVLSYGDYLIRSSDVDILRSNSWLNDTLIGFFFEYLSSRRYPASAGFRFFGPEVTQCLKLGSTEDMPLLLGPVSELAKSTFMFWAVNDAADPHDLFGGTHWSLLIYSRRENFFGHFDSTMTDGGGNDRHARILYEKLRPYVSLSAGYRNVMCEAQKNGYDCGIHVLCNAEMLADCASKHGRMTGAPSVPSDVVEGMRPRLLRLISMLSASKRR